MKSQSCSPQPGWALRGRDGGGLRGPINARRTPAFILMLAVAMPSSAEPITVEHHQLPDGGAEVFVNRTADGSVVYVVDVELATVLEHGTGKQYDLAGGVWLDDAISIQYARELHVRRAREQYFKAKAARIDPGPIVGLLLTGASAYAALARWGPQLLGFFLPQLYPPKE